MKTDLELTRELRAMYERTGNYFEVARELGMPRAMFSSIRYVLGLHHRPTPTIAAFLGYRLTIECDATRGPRRWIAMTPEEKYGALEGIRARHVGPVMRKMPGVDIDAVHRKRRIE